MKGRIWPAIGLALAICVSGCENAGEEKAEVQPVKEEVVLEFYTWKDEEEYMKDMAEEYRKEHPEIKIALHALPASEYRQKLEILFHGDKAIDVFASSKPSGGEVNREKGYALDLSPYEPYIDVSGYGEWFEDLKAEGKMIMLPYRMSSWVIYYNKKIFDEAGLPYPKEKWTWEEYTETAKKLTGMDENGEKIYGSMSFDLSGSWWRTPARTTGDENPLKPEGLKQLKKAAKWSYEMAYEAQIQPRYTDFTSSDNFDYIRMFLQGNTGMFFCGEWCLPMLNSAILRDGLDFEYDVAPMPYWEGEQSYAVATAAVMQVAAKSVHPEEAMDFVEFICGEEGAKLLAERSLLPAWGSPEIKEIFQASMAMPSHSEYFFSKGKISQILPDRGYEEALEIVRRNVSQYLLQEISLEQAFDKSKAEFAEKGLERE